MSHLFVCVCVCVCRATGAWCAARCGTRRTSRATCSPAASTDRRSAGTLTSPPCCKRSDAAHANTVTCGLAHASVLDVFTLVLNFMSNTVLSPLVVTDAVPTFESVCEAAGLRFDPLTYLAWLVTRLDGFLSSSAFSVIKYIYIWLHSRRLLFTSLMFSYCWTVAPACRQIHFANVACNVREDNCTARRVCRIPDYVYIIIKWPVLQVVASSWMKCLSSYLAFMGTDNVALWICLYPFSWTLRGPYHGTKHIIPRPAILAVQCACCCVCQLS